MIYHIKNNIREFSHRNHLIKVLYLLANKIRIIFQSNLGDVKYAKLKYKENTGKKLDLEEPKTFNEKLWWLKLNNRDPLLTKCSDKVCVRDYVKDCGLEHILNEVYGVYDNANDIDFDILPNKAFIKTNHGSGANMIWDKNKPFNIERFVKKFNQYLKQNYFLQSREWNYKNIKPKLIVEKILVDNMNPSLIDYRFLCFDGNVKLIFIDIETAAEDGSHNPYAKRNVYDYDFNYMDIKVSREQFNRDLVKKPKNFEDMIKYAEILSKPFVFCRVDMYNIDGMIYFGEITFYPGGCTQLFYPEKWEKQLGDWIDLESEKIIKSDLE